MKRKQKDCFRNFCCKTHSLKNHEQFYGKLRIVKRWKAFKRIVSYKIEIVDSKVVSAQLEASKSSIKY